MAHEFFGALQVADVADLPETLDTKSDTAHPHETFAPLPFRGVIPSGSVTPVVTHNLGTNDIDVEVVEFSNQTCVGVPWKRLTANTVEFTFTTAPTSGQYVVIVTPGAGRNDASVSDPALHALQHAIGGDDPLNPSELNAAAASHTHPYSNVEHAHSGYQAWGPLATANHTHNNLLAAGSYAAVGHSHSGYVPPGGTTEQILVKNSATDLDFVWRSAATDVASPKAFSPIQVPMTEVQTPNTTFPTQHYNQAYWFCNVTQSTHFRCDLDTVWTQERNDGTANSGQRFAEARVCLVGQPVPGQVILVEVCNPWFTSQFVGYTGYGYFYLYFALPLAQYSGGVTVPVTIEMLHPHGGEYSSADRVYVGRTNIYTFIYDERCVGTGSANGHYRMLGRVPDFLIVPEDYVPGTPH